jgi:hypothetical protein
MMMDEGGAIVVSRGSGKIQTFEHREATSDKGFKKRGRHIPHENGGPTPKTPSGHR